MYDASYYALGCGQVYERNERWLSFFQQIADRIILDLAPKTVLDAGRAMGFLVEGFRNRGVEAWGIDISEYAIQNVHPSIAPHCWVGSITEPLPQSYDLIVTIEVVEHLPILQSEAAVANLCAHASDVVFSSSPEDFSEPSHLNVQPSDYWAELFARQGFYRDLDYELPYITPWAVRFRKLDDPFSRRVREYERRLWQVTRENRELRDALIKNRSDFISAQQELDKFKKSRVITFVNSILEFRRNLMKNN